MCIEQEKSEDEAAIKEETNPNKENILLVG